LLLCSMLARRQELNAQLQQLIDAFLLAPRPGSIFVTAYYI
jgi:hypothetical protein